MTEEIEKQIIHSLRDSLHEVIKSKLGGYNSPLDSIITEVINKNKVGITDLLDKACFAALNAADFKEQVTQSFTHKLAKIIISKFDGEVEKRLNEYRSNPEIRAKIILAIEKVIRELN